MILNRTLWDETALQEFYAYETTLAEDETKRTWEKRIINTELPCLGKTAGKAREAVKEIKKGNYLSFLDGLTVTTLFDSLVSCFLISAIKDFDTFEHYLLHFLPTFDNWASCDSITFAKKDGTKLLALADSLLQSPLPFTRRVGVGIYLELIKREGYTEQTFALLDNLIDEKEYYVNMCGAWLLAESFTHHRDETVAYLQRNHTNTFILQKGISKCRDSYRITPEDKEFLLQFKNQKA